MREQPGHHRVGRLVDPQPPGQRQVHHPSRPPVNRRTEALAIGGGPQRAERLRSRRQFAIAVQLRRVHLGPAQPAIARGLGHPPGRGEIQRRQSRPRQVGIAHQQRPAVGDVLGQSLPLGRCQLNVTRHNHHGIGVDGPPLRRVGVGEDHIEDVAKHSGDVHLVGPRHGLFAFGANWVPGGPEKLLEHPLVVAEEKAVLVPMPVLEAVGPERRRLPAVRMIDQERHGRQRSSAVRLGSRQPQKPIDQLPLGRELHLVQPRGGRSPGLPEFVKALFVVEHRRAGHVLVPDVELVPRHSRAAEHAVVVVVNVLRRRKTLRVADNCAGVAKVATAVGRRQVPPLPGRSPHERPPHRQHRRGRRRRFVANGLRSPVGAQRHEHDVPHRQARDHIAVRVRVEIPAIDLAILLAIPLQCQWGE